MKRKFIRLFVFLGFILSFIFVGISSLAATASMENGARIRTTGNQGLMFTATVDSLDDTLGHGFYVVLGEHTAEAISNAVNNQETKVDGNVLKKVAVEGENTTFKVVVYNINEAYYEQKITAVSYVETESGIEVAAASVTRSIGQVARGLYNEDNNVDSFIADIAKNGAIKVEGSSKDRYYNSLSEVVFEDGDTIKLPAGTYADNFTINANNVTILGPNAEKAGTANDREEEAVLTGVVTLATKVNNTTLNGLKFTQNAKITSSALTVNELTINNTGFSFINNYVESTLTSNSFISFKESDKAYNKDIIIENNYFKATQITTNLINLHNNINLTVLNNEFDSISNNIFYVADTTNGKGLAGDLIVKGNNFNNIKQYAFNINWIAHNEAGVSSVNISNNEFTSQSSTYAYINIENSNKNLTYKEFKITQNIFKDRVRTIWFDGKVISTTEFSYNYIETDNATGYICKSDNADGSSVLEFNNNIYVSLDESIVYTAETISSSLFGVVAENYTSCYNTIDEYQAALEQLNK